MKISNYHYATSVIRNVAYILMGIFAMFQFQGSLPTLLLLLIVLGLFDVILNFGELLLEKRNRTKWEIYTIIFFECAFIFLFVILFKQSMNQYDGVVFHNPLLTIGIGVLFSIVIVFNLGKSIKLLRENNILAYIVLVDAILSTLMAIFLVYTFQVMNNDIFLLFGIYAVGFGAINLLLNQFVKTLLNKVLRENGKPCC